MMAWFWYTGLVADISFFYLFIDLFYFITYLLIYFIFYSYYFFGGEVFSTATVRCFLFFFHFR